MGSIIGDQIEKILNVFELSDFSRKKRSKYL
jgi:hypothetical protein